MWSLPLHIQQSVMLVRRAYVVDQGDQRDLGGVAADIGSMEHRFPSEQPANAPSKVHASTECAQPARCNSRYTPRIRSSIHPPARRGSAQPSRTASKWESTRISYRDCILRSDRETRSASSGMTPRASGEYQPISPRLTGIGKTPLR